MTRLLETCILYLLLVIFAIYGVTYLAPLIADTVTNYMIQAIESPEKVRL